MATNHVRSLEALGVVVSRQAPKVLSVPHRSLTSAARLRSLEMEPRPQLSVPPVFQRRQQPSPPRLSDPFLALIESLTHSLSTTSSPHLPILHRLLRSYSSDSNHWSRYAHANPSKQYTRNLVHEVPRLFNLLLLVWTPGKASPVHDHADSHCLMKILSGTLRERRFAFPDGTSQPLRMTNDIEVRKNKVAYISDQLGLHEISNPSDTEYAVSLHLYTPPNAAMRGCHVFEERNGIGRHVMQGVYDSVRGVVHHNL